MTQRMSPAAQQIAGHQHQQGVTGYPVAGLPSAVTAGNGAKSYVIDALSPVANATVVGGGTTFTPVHSDGTNWKVG